MPRYFTVHNMYKGENQSQLLGSSQHASMVNSWTLHAYMYVHNMYSRERTNHNCWVVHSMPAWLTHGYLTHMYIICRAGELPEEKTKSAEKNNYHYLHS